MRASALLATSLSVLSAGFFYYLGLFVSSLPNWWLSDWSQELLYFVFGISAVGLMASVMSIGSSDAPIQNSKLFLVTGLLCIAVFIAVFTIVVLGAP